MLREGEELPPDPEAVAEDMPPPAAKAKPPPAGRAKPPKKRAPEHLTDLGNARRMLRAFGSDLRYSRGYQGDGWAVWDGRRWRPDTTMQVQRYAKHVSVMVEQEAQALFARATSDAEKDEAQRIRSWARRSESMAAIRNMVACAESEPGIPVEMNEFDTHPWLLNCENGTLDLQSGKLLPHDRKHLLTKLAPVAYDPAARCPRFEAFLRRIFAGDKELIGFMQRALGYSLIGEIREHVFFILHGTGANGKSTLVETIRRTLGDYAMNTPPRTFMAKRGDSIPNDLAALAGARFVSMAETREGQALDESLVKSVTGGDTISARFLHREYFEFQPQLTPWMLTNHRPRIQGTDEGIWRRLRLVPFKVAIPDQEQDRELLKKLQAEGAGILAWLAEGCRQWRQGGLREPSAVLDATQEYREAEDTVARFVRERCEVVDGASFENGALYKEYGAWCEMVGEMALSHRKFTPRMKALGFQQRRGSGRRWLGLRLLPLVASGLDFTGHRNGIPRAHGQADPLVHLGGIPLGPP